MRRSTRRKGVNPCIAGVFGLLAGTAAAALAAVQYPRGLPPPDNGFSRIGAAACRTCHRDLYVGWESSPHGRAASVLSFEQTFDPQCAPCHLPDDGILDDGVGCEACHGPGSAYAELDVMIDPLKRLDAGLRDPAETCAFCHNPGHPFHVERDLENTVIHGRRP